MKLSLCLRTPLSTSLIAAAVLLAASPSGAEEPTGLNAEQAVRGALQVGDAAVDGVLLDNAGNKVQLSDLWKEHPLVVVWYRGGWCPICMRHLSSIQAVLPELNAAGAKLVAIAPEQPEMASQTAAKNGFEFLLLSDPGNAVGEKYGIVFTLDPGTAQKYQKMFDLEKYNGDSSMKLPVPVAYVINQEGKITFAFVEPDYRQRVDPADLLEALSPVAAAQ